MQPTDAEKFVSLMLSDIREHLEIEGEDAEKLILLMLEEMEGDNNTGRLEWVRQGVFQSPGDTPVTAAQVISALKGRKANRS